ncbi:DUF6478 family protein [Cribrihabitans neustonicus]|uniref:DUF6478 family protein n=1 Tax=Cribrihabitans neustonicus TaxID=1429085 RepID=UPI003B5BD696
MARILDQLLHTRCLRHWRRAASGTAAAPLGELRRQRGQARALRAQLDDFLRGAEARLALPKMGSQAFPREQGTDWGWRPDLWCRPLAERGIASAAPATRLNGGVQLFHDCPRAELSLRQLRNTRPEDLAPFGLRMDVFEFDGSFLSLSIDLPAGAADGLTRGHLVQLGCALEAEHPLDIFARLNIEHGPNTEQIVRELPQPGQTQSALVEFDLAYSRLNEKRTGKIWLDLIFEAPEMNQIVLRDLTLARLRRAAI